MKIPNWNSLTNGMKAKGSTENGALTWQFHKRVYGPGFTYFDFAPMPQREAGLDPRSGFPVNHWRSISVLAPVAVAAGSCSTIAMLKEADGLPFLNDAGVAWLAIDNEGAIHSWNLQNLS